MNDSDSVLITLFIIFLLCLLLAAVCQCAKKADEVGLKFKYLLSSSVKIWCSFCVRNKKPNWTLKIMVNVMILKK